MKRQELAPAKVNLTLDVGARRPDGYHEVVSVMQSVALYDTVTMESGTGEGISLTCDDAAIPADGSNLAWRAAEVFFRTTGVACDGLHITLEKSIPSQAGLGGGSSDAAAVLRGLRKLYAPELPMEALERMGMELGSDVPYCVRGGTVLVQGKGEQLLSLRALPEGARVLADSATANSRINARLPYIFLLSRIAHYLKLIQRENIGTTKDRRLLELELNTWVRSLVTEMTDPGDELQASHPLRDAKVVVEDIEDNPGFFRVKLFAVPHFQVEGMDVNLSLVSQMPKAKA